MTITGVPAAASESYLPSRGLPPTAVEHPAAAFAGLTGAVTLPSQASNGVAYCVNPSAMYASVSPHMMQPVPTAAEEAAAIRLVHVLVTCAGAVEAGDYSAAHANLYDAHSILAGIPTATGIGRVAHHFAAALSHRLAPAYPYSAPPSATPGELHCRFYEAGPYLKFAYSTANLAILDAFEGCDAVHVVDLSIMQGLQWPELIHALSKREGGAPYLRITGISPPPTTGADEVGVRLAELARSLNVPFSFRSVCADQLDGLRPWMLDIVPGETVAFNSVLQLHRLLVDPDADPAVPAPIDTLLEWVGGVRPRVVTVVEQEADHNRPSLLDRFANALFHYASVFDSMETVGGRGALAEAYLRAEIFDVVCGEGSARAERHELGTRWRERLARAGMAQVPFGPRALHQATEQLVRLTSGSPGYGVLECGGSLALSWHDRPLYSVTAWRATGGDAAGAVHDTLVGVGRRKNDGNGTTESNGSADNNNNIGASAFDEALLMPLTGMI
jgi:DELLA protein